MTKISKLIFLLCSTVSLYAMRFDDGYFVRCQTADYTIFGYFKGSGKLHQTFSFLSSLNITGQEATTKISEKEVKKDARANANGEFNNYLLVELKEFKSELAKCQNKEEYEKKCLIMYLLQQSRLLKHRLSKQQKPIPKDLIPLKEPNIYILEHLNDIEEEKNSPCTHIIDQLEDNSFWYH